MTTDSNERDGVGHDAHFYLDQIEKYQGGRNGPTIQLRAAIEQIEAELARWTPAAAPQAQPSDGWITSPDGLSRRLAAPTAAQMVPMTAGGKMVAVGAYADPGFNPQAQPAKAEQMPLLDRHSENLLRRLLCIAFAGPLAYMDDGEAQDNRAMPMIDFLRDTPAAIEEKMRQRNLAARSPEPAPIDMILHCPACGRQHIDAPDGTAWTNPPHRSHLCLCGHTWRPADVPTNGVRAITTCGNLDSTPCPPVHRAELALDLTYLLIALEALRDFIPERPRKTFNLALKVLRDVIHLLRRTPVAVPMPVNGTVEVTRE